jgi:hypothetical protein
MFVGFFSAGLVTAAYAQPPAGTWDILSNGVAGRITLTVSALGDVSGTWTEGTRVDSVTGLWDETSKKLLFVRRISVNLAMIQVYTGYFFSGPATFCDPGTEFREVVAGTFEAFRSTGATPQRDAFGWAMRKCLP